jgi:hypothetical protein
VRSRGPRRAALAAAAALALGVLAGAGPARAFELDRVAGHLSFGYSGLIIRNAPSGSLAVTGGFDYPLASGFREGIDIAFSLYGSRGFTRGSLDATVDYSSLDLIAFTHWEPARGPFARISLGPGLGRPRAELNAAAGGAQFLDLAVHEMAPAVALDLTVMQRRPAPVRVAFVLGARCIFHSGETWNEVSGRLGFHY